MVLFLVNWRLTLADAAVDSVSVLRLSGIDDAVRAAVVLES